MALGVRIDEAVVEHDRKRLLLTEHLGKSKPHEEPDLLLGAARERLEPLRATVDGQPRDRPVVADVEARPRQERFEVRLDLLLHGRHQPHLDLVTGGRERLRDGSRGFGTPHGLVETAGGSSSSASASCTSSSMDSAPKWRSSASSSIR